jgi:Chlorophyllase enzyme
MRRRAALLATIAVFVGASCASSASKQGRTASTVPTTTSTATTSSTTTTTTTVARSAGPPWSVRQTIIEIDDPTRPTPARGSTPAHPGRHLRTTLRWPVGRDGQLAPGRLPLFVFAHGFNVSAATYSGLLDVIARAGVVVAAPDFPGESTAYPGRANEADLPSEPCDIEFVATSLERHPPAPLQHALLGAPLVVGGHSDGGTAAASAGYASSCSDTPITGVVALSPNDVKMTAAYRFGTPPPLLAMTGSADEVNPTYNTRALYAHAPGRAWLVTVDGGRHLATFTTDPDLARIASCIIDFVLFAADHDIGAARRLGRTGGGRLHLAAR